MDLLNYKHGQNRVVIEHLSPEIESGRYPVKTIIGEKLMVTADIYADGHDHLSAFLKYKKSGEEAWHKVRMKPTYNDQYFAEFVQF